MKVILIGDSGAGTAIARYILNHSNVHIVAYATASAPPEPPKLSPKHLAGILPEKRHGKVKNAFFVPNNILNKRKRK